MCGCVNCQPPLHLYNFASGCPQHSVFGNVLHSCECERVLSRRTKGQMGFSQSSLFNMESNMCLGQSNTSLSGRTMTIQAKAFLPHCPAALLFFSQCLSAVSFKPLFPTASLRNHHTPSATTVMLPKKVLPSKRQYM